MTSVRKRGLVSGWMTTHIISVEPQDALFDAVEKMAERAIRHVLVTEGDRLTGILSNRDLVRSTFRTPDRRLDLHGVTVSEVMTPKPITTTPDTTLAEAARLMVQHAINALPVVEGERPVGVLSSDDLLRALSVQELCPPLPQV
ncbi:MAG: CBS domain-containing protein [Planctomycetes bacterium]|nr:CBS domain-containing protein [Planctomycetota bacterium]